jgi:hypothetical protein
MAAKNPLLDRPPVVKMTPQERVVAWNANIDEVNFERAKEGLGPVHWVLRDGRMAIEWWR